MDTTSVQTSAEQQNNLLNIYTLEDAASCHQPASWLSNRKRLALFDDVIIRRDRLRMLTGSGDLTNAR